MGSDGSAADEDAGHRNRNTASLITSLHNWRNCGAPQGSAGPVRRPSGQFSLLLDCFFCYPAKINFARCVMNLFSILILIDSSKIKNKDLIIGLLVGLTFLTKQTIGICLLIPCIFYSKHKIKSLIGFIYFNYLWFIL